MKRMIAGLLALLFLTIPAFAAGPNEPGLSATCAILVDAESGRVLYEKAANVRRPIASITKLMTALVAVRSTPDLSQEVTIKREHTLTIGSSMYLKVGERLTLETLLYGLLLVSGNDAALAIAETCAGSVETFVGWMNDWSAELGMKNTHFVNPSGLPDDAHYSSAADMALLARAALEDARLVKIFSTKSITLGDRHFLNHNKLLWQYEGCIGMKTGYTDKAGRTLVSCAEREGRRLIVVTLNAPNDWKDHAALLDYGFQKYPRQTLAKAGQEVGRVTVTGSLVRMVPVAAVQDVCFPLGEGERVTSKATLPQQAPAPIRKGSLAGEMTFYLDGKEIGRTYLMYAAGAADDRPGRLMDWVREFFGRKMTMEERLQKILSACGVASRRAAEGYLVAGRVTVNGVVVGLGDKADLDRDVVALDGISVRQREEHTYLMLNKPSGYVTTLADEKGRPTVAELVADCGKRVWPVGRLDYNSEGLLLMTDDGEFTNRLTHPRYEKEKEYLVTVSGDVEAAIPILAGPMTLDGVPLAPAGVKRVGERQISITIHEGKNRQVRRMCAAAGLTVKRLQRIREGCLTLGGLPTGKWKYLTDEELEGLK